MRLTRSLPGFGGTMGRLAYVGSIVGACAAAALFSVAVRGADPAQAATPQPATAWTGLAFSLCVLWLLICINARRLRDAGLSAWWGLFPFAVGVLSIPLAPVMDAMARSLASTLLNTGFVLVLALLPPRPSIPAPGSREIVTA